MTTADPVVAVGDTDSMLATSVYQRLMHVLPGTGELKPDLATDCLFTSRTVYECTLPDELTFHNGDVLDSSDVKFSLQRALRMGTTNTSIGLLAALKRIDTPDARTVRFHLSWADNQFGYALAGQAASVVDEQVYDPDAPLPLETPPVGSGQFQVTSIAAEEVSFTRFDTYVGPREAILTELRLQVVADSVAAEAAIAEGTADVVWRSLDSAAVQRVSDEIAASPDKATATGFTRYSQPGVRVTQLVWDAASKLRKNNSLRLGLAKALQADRTLDSVVPVGVPDHASAFALGGRPKLPELNGKRIKLTLGYSGTAPGHADLARLLRDRIEGLDGVSVRLVTTGGADLWLTDRPAWVNNATGWLQRYVAKPLAGSSAKLEELVQRSRTTTGSTRTVALTELQQQAAADNTVLPVSQGEGILMLGKGVTLVGDAFGSGQQLGLWGINRA
ncbi:MAG TPA: ABC transporter substrate-binding protein [Propionicimonas sp.]|nr:ABC transporter substrate-binding protein [Propionicimonas sp.]HRA07433.1 ABC transporter substrate-binding protein [Propionicimonas sp.]